MTTKKLEIKIPAEFKDKVFVDSYLYINSTDTTASDNNYLQNVHVHLGVKGTSSENRLIITVPDRALTYSTDYYVKNSQQIFLEE